jgi:hypothetical protein
MSDDVLQNFKSLPDDLKRLILRKFQIMTKRENKREVKCLKLFVSSPQHAMFQSDGIKLLVTPSKLECGVEKTRGFGLRYGVVLEANQTHVAHVSPTSRAFTRPECERIIRAFCNIVNFVIRINRPEGAFIDTIKAFAQSIKAFVMHEDNMLQLIPPKDRNSKAHVTKIKTIVNSLFDCKRVMLWDSL